MKLLLTTKDKIIEIIVNLVRVSCNRTVGYNSSTPAIASFPGWYRNFASIRIFLQPIHDYIIQICPP